MHYCILEKSSLSGIPAVAPQSAKIYYRFRQFKKIFLVSERHYLTTKLFRSSSMLFQEKRRQVKLNLWYIIHPFSVIKMAIEIIMTITWLGTLFMDIFILSFYDMHTRTPYAMIPFEIINAHYIVISFFLGYLEVSTNEIILNQKKISIRYVSTYFFFDVLGVLPLTILYRESNTFAKPSSSPAVLGVIKMFRCIRLATMLDYSRQITKLLKISDTHHKLIYLVVLYLYLLHFSACLIFLLPNLENYFYGKLDNKSWVSQAKLLNKSVQIRYVLSMHTAMCNFMSAGTGMYEIADTKDQIAFSLIMILGFGYTLFMTAVVLQMVSSTSASESKYEELVHNLHEYAIRKKMPHMLRLRLLLYYENRFQKRYFRESVILASLSEHLRYEILLHSCKHLFKKLTIFHGLSKVVLGTIIACLKQEVYLPNDVIIKADAPTDAMFLIGYGTLALYTIDGLEIMHLEDGDHIGEMGLLRPDSDKLLNVVAIETSELYKLEKQDFFRIMHRYDDFAQRMQKVVAEELNVVGRLQDHLSRLHGKHDIINDLRHGKILEQSYRRNFSEYHKQ